MSLTRLGILAVGGCLALAGTACASEPPSFVRAVKPFLGRYCVECHNPGKLKGGLNLESYKSLVEGGKTGPVVVAGNPDDSRLVLLAEHREKPFMPPPRTRQPKPADVAVLRAWVAAGATDDTTTQEPAIPDIKPRGATVAPVASLAYQPDGKVLAASTQSEVLFIDTASNAVTGKLAGQTGKVTALAYSKDGQRLAVASGAVGKSGDIRLYTLPPAGSLPVEPGRLLQGHHDTIYDLAFSPDGKQLASCGYDRLIKLWDVAAGRELHTLKDHSDAVYSLAFSPDGKLLASASADRAVKVWDVATGTRLYTLGEATDWVYAVCWSPLGGHLAAGGVDRSIRVWEVSREGGKLTQAVFAHEGAITRLAYSADGKILYSLGEDHTTKSWNATALVERRVYAHQVETPLALAVRPDQKQLALGRIDGGLLLLEEATGKVQAQPLPRKPVPPKLARLVPNSGRRGQTVRVRFEGADLDGVLEVTKTLPGISAKIVPGSQTVSQVQFDVSFPADTPAGAYPLGLKNAVGASAPVPLTLDLFAQVAEVEPNDSAGIGQKITLPASVAGAIGQPGDVDFYRFEAAAGTQLGVQVLTTAPASKLEPVLQLTEASGQVLVESTDGLLGYTFARAGTYALSVRDRDYRGGAEMLYRLHAGDLPVVTALFPLGLQRGSEAEIHVEGVNLGGVKSVRVKAPAGAAPGTGLAVPLSTAQGVPLGNLHVVVGDFPEVVAQTQPGTLAMIPGTANGQIDRPGKSETWRFPARQGHRLIVEVDARRIGSALDSTIEILDAKGQPVPRAVLRCLAKTYMTFRDHDSASPGIRLEGWSEFAMNDYVAVGDELLRIEALPKNPDDDCQFFSVGGRRVGFLDTTPTFHSNGSAMYKVTVHPPGSVFPPNGLPLLTLFYRNDDGGPGYGKDSRIFFDPPADGEYLVRVADARGEGSSQHSYRLTIRPPAPSFTITFNPTTPAVWKGGAVPISVTATRTDGFDGPIAVRLDNVPSGFHAPATSIPAGENSTAFALFAEAGAQVPAKAPPLKLVASASIGGHEIVREAGGGLPRIIDPGEIVTMTQQSAVAVQPGKDVAMTVTIERRNGFKGRVPLEVRGLPHGVHVLDVGLNGILITEADTTRSFVIHAEPWVQPTEHPFVVLARREGTSNEYAAKSVLLKVVKSP